MILKLLISSFFLSILLSGCSNGSYSYLSAKDDEFIALKEVEFERDLKDIFTEIDNSKESIRTVEEKQKLENRVVEKENSMGAESFFRKTILQRFKNE